MRVLKPIASPETLFHFSDDPSIDEFVPRPVRVPSPRPEGMEWLNGPLVWAIDANYAFQYLFPRDCPRILLWCTDETSRADFDVWISSQNVRAIAYVERAWLSPLTQATLYRYHFELETFESLSDRGIWISKSAIRPRGMTALHDLPQRLKEQGVEIRVTDDFSALKGAWQSSVHASGIRLRNAASWKPF